MKKRLIILLVFLLLSVSTVSAVNAYAGNVEYLSNAQITVGCGDSCPTGRYVYFDVNVCGEEFTKTRGGRFNARLEESDYPLTLEFAVPYSVGFFGGDEAPCSQGDHSVVIEPYSGNNKQISFDNAETTLTVNPKGSMEDPHIGKYLYFGMREDTDPNRLASFFLSDKDPEYWDVDPNYGNIEKDDPLIIYRTHSMTGSSEAATKADIGGIAEVSSSGYINQVARLSDGSDIFCTYDGGGVNTARCEIGDEKFSTGTNNRLHNSDLHGTSTISPIHQTGKYWPDGEIIVGYQPEYDIVEVGGTSTRDASKSNEGPKFFICREGAEMKSKETVTGNKYTSQVVNVNDPSADEEELYKCNLDDPTDTDYKDWVPVEKCGDGLDNEGDAKIDTSDPACNTESGPTENETTTACKTGVKEVPVFSPLAPSNIEMLAAQYTKTDGSCSTDGTPFSTSNDDLLINNLDNDPYRVYCDDSPAQPSDPLPCIEETFDFSGFGHSQMPVAVFYPTLNYFRQVERADDTLDFSDGDVYDTGFVEDGLGWTYKTQSLYEAEQKYWSTTFDTCLSTGACQFYTNWEDRIRMPEVEQAYNNSDSSLNSIAWLTGGEGGPFNAGTNVSNSPSGQDDVLSKDSSEIAIFDGGFAGKCESDEVWQYKPGDDEWKCSGDIDWQQTAYLPKFDSLDNDNAGLIFPPYNFINDKSNLPDYINNRVGGVQEGLGWNSFETAWEEAPQKTGTVDVQSIDAKCWNGTKGLTQDQIKESENYIESNFNVNVTQWFTIDVPDNPSDPVANFRPLTHDGTYSCAWRVNAETSFGTTITEWDAQDFMVEMQNHLGNTISGEKSIAVKNMTEDSSYAGSLPDATGSSHDWTSNELTQAMNNWN